MFGLTIRACCHFQEEISSQSPPPLAIHVAARQAAKMPDSRDGTLLMSYGSRGTTRSLTTTIMCLLAYDANAVPILQRGSLQLLADASAAVERFLEHREHN